MGAFWRHRVAKDEKDGKLHFVYARYRSDDPSYRCGLAGIWNEGADIEAMRRLARELLAACDEPVIPLTESGDEGSDEDDETGNCQSCGCELDSEELDCGRDICFNCYCEQQD